MSSWRCGILFGAFLLAASMLRGGNRPRPPRTRRR